jgi:peptidoglycan/LPS O-acetylase OafA/YrhL
MVKGASSASDSLRVTLPGATGERVASLDGVRGLAVLLVLFYHFVLYGGPGRVPPADSSLVGFTGFGWIGVDLFFVLSGFLITGILYDAKGSPGYFRNFYARRVLRIFPLYYGVLFGVFVLLPLAFPESERLQLLRQDAGWYWTYLANVKIAGDGWGQFPALGHFWSLAVEEQFYLCWPVLVLLLSRRGLLKVCVGCVVASGLLRVALYQSGEGLAAYVLTPARADTLALGAFVALVARGPAGLAGLRRWSPPVLALCLAGTGGIFLARGPDYHDPIVLTLGFTLLAGLFAALVGVAVSAPEGGLTRRGLGAPLLVSVGRYSYAMYVFHHLLLFFKPDAFSSALFPPVLGSEAPPRLAFAVLGIFLTFGMAMLSWHVYEKQFLKLKGLFPYGVTPRPFGRLSDVAGSPRETVKPDAALS